MNPLTRFSLAVRRRETPLYDFLYRTARRVRGLSMPVIPWLHRFLYREWAGRTLAWHTFWRIVYYEPMFKSMCRRVGSGFTLHYAGNGTCRILGNLRLDLGDNVTFFDNISLAGLKVFDEPVLSIGDNSYIGPRCRFMVARSISIGRHCILGSEIMLMDNTGHPAEADLRLAPGGGSPPVSGVRDVRIGDFCFFGAGCYIYPGATISDGVMARVGTHLMGDIPPFSVVAGNPGRVSRLLAIPPAMREIAGEKRFLRWQSAQQAFAEANPQVKIEE